MGKVGDRDRPQKLQNLERGFRDRAKQKEASELRETVTCRDCYLSVVTVFNPNLPTLLGIVSTRPAWVQEPSADYDIDKSVANYNNFASAIEFFSKLLHEHTIDS